MYEQLAVGTEHAGPGGDAGFLEVGGGRARAVAIANVDEGRARDRHERVVAERAERDVRGQVAVVDVEPLLEVLHTGRGVETREHRADRVVLGQRLAITNGAALDVVLFRRDPRLGTVGRDRDREQVVGHAAAGLVGIRTGIDDELGRAAHGHRRRVDPTHRAAGRSRDEVGDPQRRTIARQRKAPGPRTDRERLGHLKRGRIDRHHAAQGHQRHVRAVGPHHDRGGLRRERQAQPAGDLERVQVHDRDRVVLAVGDPQPPVRCDRQRRRPVEDGDLGDLLQRVGIDHADRVVVEVGVDHQPPRLVVDDRGRRPWRALRPRAHHGVRRGVPGKRRRRVAHQQVDRVVPGLGERVLDRRHVRRPVGGRRAVAEVPAVLHLAGGIGHGGREDARLAEIRGRVGHDDLERMRRQGPAEREGHRKGGAEAPRCSPTDHCTVKVDT